MPTYKLMYFNNRGKAEPIRLAFHLAGVEFIDHRFQDGEWPKVKPETPQGKCPVLEVDGKMIPQSVAILNYVARQYGLYGKDNMENAEVDAAVATVEDIFFALSKAYGETDEQKKKKIKDDFRNETFSRFCQIFCTMIDQASSGWLVGSKISIADLAVYNVFEFVQAILNPEQDVEEDVLKDWAKLLRHRRKIRDIEAINKYLSSRPVTSL